MVRFLQIQIPTDRTSGIRTRATQMLTNKLVEICSTPLTTAPRWPQVNPTAWTQAHVCNMNVDFFVILGVFLTLSCHLWWVPNPATWTQVLAKGDESPRLNLWDEGVVSDVIKTVNWSNRAAFETKFDMETTKIMISKGCGFQTKMLRCYQKW